MRPILEYACSAWDPYLATHIHSIEMVQRRAARFIFNDYGRESSVTKMMCELKLATLVRRRKAFRLSLLFKIDSGLIPLSLPENVTRKLIQGRNDNGKSFVHIPSRTNPFFNSFYVRTIRDWNDLPGNIVMKE